MRIRNVAFFLVMLMVYGPTLAFSGVQAAEKSAAQNQENNGFFEKLDALKNRAISETQGVKNQIAPRVVAKEKKPEVIIKNESIYFNGVKLALGDSLQTWKDALSGKPRCNKGRIVVCVWEEYGLQLGTDDSLNPRARFLNIYVSFVDDEGNDLGRSFYPDGKSNLAINDWQVHEVFPGYLELDGYGIDSSSMFWEIKSEVNKKRNLSCGIRDCATPVGAFGDDGELQFRLNGNHERSTVRKFSISRTLKK